MRRLLLAAALATGIALSAQEWPRHLYCGGNQLVDMGPLDAAHVRGSVTDPTGATIPRARVQVQLRKSERIVKNFEADEHGHFRLPYLSPGHYWLGVSAPGFNLHYWELNVEPGATTKTLRVQLTVGT